MEKEIKVAKVGTPKKKYKKIPIFFSNEFANLSNEIDR